MLKTFFQTMKRPRIGKNTLVFEELEPRLLFSADGAEALAAPIVEQEYEEPVVIAAPESPAEANAAVDQPTKESAPAATDSPAVQEIAASDAPPGQDPTIEQTEQATEADNEEDKETDAANTPSVNNNDNNFTGQTSLTDAPEQGVDSVQQTTAQDDNDRATDVVAQTLEDGSDVTKTIPLLSTEDSENTTDPGPSLVTGGELVFVNDNVQDYQQIVDDIQQNSDRQRTIDVVVLHDKTEGITQVSNILQEHENLDAIHIISHASDGFLQLGSSWYNTDDLRAQAGTLGTWNQALMKDGDLLLYGCNLAENDDGKLFVDTLSNLTGFDVAASDDQTGSAERRGDWDLEYTVGTVDTGSPFTAELSVNWNHALATYTVTNTNDSGAGSLRQAIIDANNNSGLDIITFNIDASDSGYVFYEDDGTANSLTGAVTHSPTQADSDFSDGWYRIQLNSTLPDISDAITIDGWSQPGFTDHPIIELDGSAAGSNCDALSIQGGSSTIQGLVINSFDGDGIQLLSNGNNTIIGNYIGTDISGTLAAGVAIDGIYVETDGNSIGGSSSTDRNLISNNHTGVVFSGAGASGNQITDNYIGTDVTGSVDFGNSVNGILIENGADGNIIGGPGTGQGNVISGNTENGIYITGEDSDNTRIQNNRIGISADGTTVLANDLGGILIENGADGTIIGGAGANEGNIIGGNGQRGVEAWGASSGMVIQGNFIGTDKGGTPDYGNNWEGVYLGGNAENNLIGGTMAGAGNTIANNAFGIRLEDTAGTGNSILGNSVYNNDGKLGIDFRDSGTEDSYGVTANDSDDGDTGTNNLQNFPVLTSAGGTDSQITIVGTLNSTANSYFRVEFFANSTDNASGHGEGQTYLGFANVATDGSGHTAIDANVVAVVADGDRISATATKCIDSTYSTFTDTSEFAQNITADILFAPVNHIPANLTTDEDTALIFNSANNNLISITDSDVGSTTMDITLSSTHGALTLNQTTGLTFVIGTGTAESSMEFRGTLADINAALDGLNYVPTADYNGSDTLTISTLDSELLNLNFDTNLSGRYTFDNNSLPGKDTSPAGGNAGTLVDNATIATDGTRGEVLSLDGFGDYLSIPGLYGEPAEGTLSA